MMNNDALRRIRYTFNFNDSKMMDLFKSSEITVTREQVSNWLKQDEDPDYKDCEDLYMTSFLDGLITEKRGPREGEPPKVEKRLSNNIILRKLTIAFNLKAEDTLELLKMADFVVSKHELSAFFRKLDHKHYRECKDQILRNFLKGMQLKYHVNKTLA